MMMNSTAAGMFGAADFIGGHVALDFLNTVSDIDKHRQHSRLGVWTHFEQWLRAANLATDSVILPTDNNGRGAEAGEARVLSRVHELRESTHAVFLAFLTDTVCDTQVQDQLQRMICAAIGRASFQCLDTSNIWSPTLDSRHHHVDQLALIIHRFLNVAPLHKLGECSSCSWLFLNTGRGKARRWCDMSSCGNRAKAAAHRKRQRLS